MSEKPSNLSDSERLYRELNNLAYSCIYGREKDIKDEFQPLFESLYAQSDIDCYYWQYCTLNVYKKTFNKRLEKYLDKFVDAIKTDFISNEIDEIGSYLLKSQNEGSKKKYYSFIWKLYGEDFDVCLLSIEEFISKDLRQQIVYSHSRKLEYLIELLDEEGTPETKNEVYFDFSGNSDSEKIVFLHELGILDYLRKIPPFNTSTNKLAEVISSFSGINQTTAQSYLNPIFSKGVDNSKSPLTANNLKKVSEKLIKMGYFK